MDGLPRMTNDGRPIVVPFVPVSPATRTEAPTFRPLSEAWNDPHEIEMRRLYAEQEKHQLAADLAEIGRYAEPSDEEIDRMALEYATWKFGGKP